MNSANKHCGGNPPIKDTVVGFRFCKRCGNSPPLHIKALRNHIAQDRSLPINKANVACLFLNHGVMGFVEEVQEEERQVVDGLGCSRSRKRKDKKLFLSCELFKPFLQSTPIPSKHRLANGLSVLAPEIFGEIIAKR